MDHNFLILFDTLERSAKSYLSKNPVSRETFFKLDQEGLNILYILYTTFMKKNNLAVDRFIKQVDDVSDFEDIDFDFDAMPEELQAILLQFADKHLVSLHEKRIQEKFGKG